MQIDVATDAASLAVKAARHLAEHLRDAVQQRGAAYLAVSGGRASQLFAALAQQDVAWDRVHVLQADERVAPEGDADRNAVMIQRDLMAHVRATFHPMPVTDHDLDAAAAAYADLLAELCGGQLDAVHLGLGDDGHTASLVSGDPALDVSDRDVVMTGEYRGRRRMTLTYPALNRARAIVWFVSGAKKATALRQMLEGGDVPAARVAKENAVAVVTPDAAPPWVGER